MARVGHENRAPEFVPHPALPGGDEQVDDQRADHDHERQRGDVGHVRRVHDLTDRLGTDPVRREEQHRTDDRRRVRLVLGVAVRMVVVGRAAREAHPHQPDHIAGAVEDRVEAIRLHRRGLGYRARHDLRDGHSQVQEQDRPQHTLDRANPVAPRLLGVLTAVPQSPDSP